MPNPTTTNAPEPMLASRVATPVGHMTVLQLTDGALVYLDFENQEVPTPPPGAEQWRGLPILWQQAPIGEVATQLR